MSNVTPGVKLYEIYETFLIKHDDIEQWEQSFRDLANFTAGVLVGVQSVDINVNIQNDPR
jgi:hypothetical protein